MSEEIKISKKTLVEFSSDPVTDKYHITAKIGDGTYGQVYRAEHKRTGTIHAIKQIPKSKIKKYERLETEIKILLETDHPNIIKLHEKIEDERNVYLVMEDCSGGELFDFIIDSGSFSERQACNVFSQIANSIKYLHAQNICHRDLKPENLLLSQPNNAESIKLIDFGLSKICDTHDQHMKTRAGTPYYISPEVIKGDYDLACDVWSLGVILYILIVGYPPFYGDTDQEIIRKVKVCEYEFDGDEWDPITAECKDLISKMLVINPTERMDIDQVLSHQWMTMNREHIPDHALNINALKNFANSSQLKKSVLMIIASQCHEGELASLREKFNEIDANHDGTITFNELYNCLTQQGMNTAQIEQMWDAIDVDKSGAISYSEWLAASLDQTLYMQRERLWQAFRVFDKDNSGKISPDELKEVLIGHENTINPAVWNQLISEADQNNDGEIDFTEFCAMMESLQNRVNFN